jgi:predicted Fe-Mo cluster-binding NifX family protein
MAEAEALRLREIEGLGQEDAAGCMNVSRPTFQRVLASARRKVADAVLNGKGLRLEGGEYELGEGPCVCRAGHVWEQGEGTGMGVCPVCRRGAVAFVERETPGDIRMVAKDVSEGERTMKIAVVTDDGKTISQHFGRAHYYVVVTVEDGKITASERRDKGGHVGGGHAQHQHGQGEMHGFDAPAQASHANMAASIKDAKVLLAGGMGRGAYESLKSYGIEPVLTDVTEIEQAVKLYLDGKLPNLMQRTH